jgi:activator of 2-hydroxyglutaryl-CoA dehydratase
MSTPNPSPAALSDESRAQLLNAEVAKYAQRGWTVQSVAAGQAVVSKNKRIGWFWNLILVIVTGGLWLIYVVYRALNRKVQTVVITVDPAGRISTS